MAWCAWRAARAAPWPWSSRSSKFYERRVDRRPGFRERPRLRRRLQGRGHPGAQGLAHVCDRRARVARRDAPHRRRAAAHRGDPEGAGRPRGLPSRANYRRHRARTAGRDSRGHAGSRRQGHARLRRADAPDQPEIRADGDPVAPGRGDPQGRADHQPAGPAEIDPRDAGGPERRRRARRLLRGSVLRRSHRRPVHRDARSGGEGIPAEVGPEKAGMKFIWTDLLLLLALLPLLIALYVYVLRRHQRRAVRFASLALVRAAMPGSARWRRHLPPALLLAALAAAILALARPSAVITLPSQQRTTILAINVWRSRRLTAVQHIRHAAPRPAARS